MKGRKDSFLFLITKIITGIIGVFSVSVQTKYLAADVLGDYSLISGITGAINSVLVSWVGSSALRYFYSYSDSEDKQKEYHTTIIIDWLVMTLASAILVFVIGQCVSSIPIKNSMILVLLVAMIGSAMDVFEKIMRASNHIVIYCVLLIVESIANIGAIILFKESITNGVDLLLIARLITASIFVVVSIFALKSFRYFSIKKYSFSLNKVFFKYGFPMVGVWGVGWLLNYSDRYIIKMFLDSSDVGLYDVAYGFAEKTIGLVTSAFNLAFFPSLIRTWKDDGKEKTLDVLKRQFNYYFMFAIPACVGIFLLSPKVYGTILDISYSEASMVMAVASIGFVFMGMNNILYKVWQLEEKTNVVLLITIVCVAINIVSNIIFIPLFGYIAAAWTTVLSYAIGTTITLILIKRKFDIKFDFRVILSILGSTTIMGVFLFFTRNIISNLLLLFVIILIAIVLYLLTLFAFGGLKEEIKEFKEWRKRKHESNQ